MDNVHLFFVQYKALLNVCNQSQLFCRSQPLWGLRLSHGQKFMCSLSKVRLSLMFVICQSYSVDSKHNEACFNIDALTLLLVAPAAHTTLCIPQKKRGVFWSNLLMITAHYMQILKFIKRERERESIGEKKTQVLPMLDECSTVNCRRHICQGGVHVLFLPHFSFITDPSLLNSPLSNFLKLEYETVVRSYTSVQ